MEPDPLQALSTFLRKVVLTIALWVAAPFFALALTFLLLQRPWWWSAIPASIGVLFLAIALVLWLVARSRLREAQARLAWVPVEERRPPQF